MKKNEPQNQMMVKLTNSDSGLKSENKNLKKELNDLRNEVKKQKFEINSLEQYSQRDCIEIKGILIMEKKP